MKKVYQVSAGQISFFVVAKSKKQAKKHVSKNSVYAGTIEPIDGVHRVRAKKPEIVGSHPSGGFIP